ncbi:MAG: ATP-binding cassette domain-containing protein, partial [Pseudomonadota bacterium]
MSLIHLRQGQLAFGPTPVLDQVELIIEPKERVCLIGRNGSGKSTLLRVIAGEQPLEGGQLQRQDGLRIATLEQAVPAAGGPPRVCRGGGGGGGGRWRGGAGHPAPP